MALVMSLEVLKVTQSHRKCRYSMGHVSLPVNCLQWKQHNSNATSIICREEEPCFLANVNSSSCSLFAVARPSVCLSVCRLSSVALVRPTQAVQIFGNISTAFGTLAIRWHPLKISRRSSQGTPLPWELNAREVVKYSDFGPTEGYISETVQNRR